MVEFKPVSKFSVSKIAGKPPTVRFGLNSRRWQFDGATPCMIMAMHLQTPPMPAPPS